jgi:hypothetical protein
MGYPNPNPKFLGTYSIKHKFGFCYSIPDLSKPRKTNPKVWVNLNAQDKL